MKVEKKSANAAKLKARLLILEARFYDGLCDELAAGAIAMIERAGANGYRTLVVTVDTAAVGNHERDVRNRVPQPLKVDARTASWHAPNMLRHSR